MYGGQNSFIQFLVTLFKRNVGHFYNGVLGGSLVLDEAVEVGVVHGEVVEVEDDSSHGGEQVEVHVQVVEGDNLDEVHGEEVEVEAHVVEDGDDKQVQVVVGVDFHN